MAKGQKNASDTATEKVDNVKKKGEKAIKTVKEIKEKIEKLIDKKNELIEKAQSTLVGISGSTKALMDKATSTLRNQSAFIDREINKYLTKINDVKEDVDVYIDNQKQNLELWMQDAMYEVAKGVGKSAGSMAKSLSKGAGMPKIVYTAIGDTTNEAATAASKKVGDQLAIAAAAQMDVIKTMVDQAMDDAINTIKSAVDMAKQQMDMVMEQVIAEAAAVQSMAHQAIQVASNTITTVTTPINNATSSIQTTITNNATAEQASKIVQSTGSSTSS